MASSTTTPSTIINPNKLITFAVTPRNGIKITPPAKLTGIPMTTHSATFGRRNKPSTINTNIDPCNRE